jgi:signal transduction histidine kinase
LLGNKLWEIGPFKDTKASKAEFRELQREDYVRYDDLPLETSAGKSISVEFVSNVYQVNGDKVIQCNIRNITERKQAEAKRKEYSRKLQVLSRRLVEAQETERRNIARELHDEIGQALTVMQLNLQAMLLSPGTEVVSPRLNESLEVVERVLEQVRDISLDLRPSILDDLGLEPALRWYTERQAALVELRVEFHADRLEQRLDSMIETECFRVAQEALTNVVRHAQAKAVTVELRKEDGQLHLRVRDDGVGFDVVPIRDQAMRGASLGLLSMEERASLAGGGLEFKSNPGKGTEVHAWFPLKWQTPPSQSETP